MPHSGKTLLPGANLLLERMKPLTKNAIFPLLKPMELAVGATLYRENESQDVIYFPLSGVVSLVYMMSSGKSAEMAVVGSDGLIGIAAVLGGRSTTSRAVVQAAGRALCIKRRAFERVVDADVGLRRLMMCYTQSLLTQIAQTAVCNRHHSIEQQWCRWILMSLDRNGNAPMRMTQQLIAETLGVRREAVSAVAQKLKTARVIDYSRGFLSVIDRAPIEERVCECYQLVVRETERLIPGSSHRS